MFWIKLQPDLMIMKSSPGQLLYLD